jgi:D-serine deaminase-like pyridoxal phosphate-dependent protein
MQISLPTLILNEDICRRNIRRMVNKAAQHGLEFRPHFKTHVSDEVGTWFAEEGVDRITCSSFLMAEYFVDSGWKDVGVAFPVNILESERIRNLAARCKLHVLAESAELVDQLAAEVGEALHVWIKIDLGYNRTGVSFEKKQEIEWIIKRIQTIPQFSFEGFLSHSGHSYQARSTGEILAVHQTALDRIKAVRGRFSDLNFKWSYGDTPCASIADDFAGIQELRPGNFVFYDVMQEQIGSCAYSDIAVVMACPVVAVHEDRDELIIYGGSVHFSKDAIEDQRGRYFGKLIENIEDPASVIQHAYLAKLSQEHGTVRGNSEWIKSHKPGDLVYILPVHSCTTANLMGAYQLLNGKKIDRPRSI